MWSSNHRRSQFVVVTVVLIIFFFNIVVIILSRQAGGSAAATASSPRQRNRLPSLPVFPGSHSHGQQEDSNNDNNNNSNNNHNINSSKGERVVSVHPSSLAAEEIEENPPFEAAKFVPPTPTRHHGLLNINKERVVLPFYPEIDSPPPIRIQSSSSSIRFFVIGDYGAANRPGQNKIADAMNQMAGKYSSGGGGDGSSNNFSFRQKDLLKHKELKAKYIAAKDDPEEQKRLVQEAVHSFRTTFNRPGGKDLDFIASTGDGIYESGVVNELDFRWKRNFEDVYSIPARRNISDKIWLGCAGNHCQASHGIFRDVSGVVRRSLVAPHRNFFFPASYYFQEFVSSRDPENSIFLAVLNSYDVSGHRTQMRKSQLKWLSSVLARTRMRHRIVVGHRPIFSAGTKHGSSKYMQERLLHVFKRFNVSHYFCGDDHQLQLLQHDNVRFVVSGGGARLEALKKSGVPGKTVFQAHSLGFVAVEVCRDAVELKFIDEHATLLFNHTAKF